MEFNLGANQIKMTPTQITVAGKKVSIKGQAMTSIQGGMVKINADGGGASQAKASLEKMAVEAKVGEFDGFGINKSVKPVQVASSGSNVPDDFGSGAIEPLFFPADMLGDFSPKNIVKNIAKKVFGKGDKSETDKGDDGIIDNKNTPPIKRKEVTLKPGEKGSWNKELNGKLAPNTDYKVGNKTYKTDDQGRVKQVSGELEGIKHDRNTYQQGKSGKEDGIKDGFKKDDGGHLISSRHDGAGEQINYVPMDSNLNRGEWKQMENKWDKALKEGKKVEVDIRPIYSGTSKRPDKFKVIYKIDGKSFKNNLKNLPKGK